MHKFYYMLYVLYYVEDLFCLLLVFNVASKISVLLYRDLNNMILLLFYLRYLSLRSFYLWTWNTFIFSYTFLLLGGIPKKVSVEMYLWTLNRKQSTWLSMGFGFSKLNIFHASYGNQSIKKNDAQNEIRLLYKYFI